MPLSVSLFVLSAMGRKTCFNQRDSLCKLLAKLKSTLEINFKRQLNYAVSLAKLKIISNFKSQAKKAN